MCCMLGVDLCVVMLCVVCICVFVNVFGAHVCVSVCGQFVLFCVFLCSANVWCCLCICVWLMCGVS